MAKHVGASISYFRRPYIEVPTNTLAHGAQRSGVVTLMGGQASTSGSSTMQVKSVYIGGGSHQGMGLNQGSSSAPLTNASLVELGKQLLSAAREGDKAEVSRLLAKGAPMTTDWLGTSPLHLAAQYGHQETAEILLRSGCQRDARTKVEKTPLHVAAQEGHDNVAELLLSNGADIDMVDMLRMTPLHWAVDRGHISMVETLLRFGADISIESKFGQTPLEIASDSGRPDIFEMLQNADQFGVTHSVQSEAATFAATQSIISEEFVDLEDSVSPIAEEELIPDPDQTEMSQDNDQAEAVKLLAAHGITLLPEDSNTLDATGLISDPSRTFALTEAGKIALGLTKTTSLTNANSSSGLVRKPTTITRIVRLNTTGLTGAGLKTQSNNSPKIIKVTPEQFAALKAGNSAKLASIPGLQSATSGLKRNIVTSLGNSEQPLDHRGNLKIVRVNPSISIQPKKPTTSASIAKPGIIIKSPPPTSNVTKTVVVTSASESLKRQLEESQKLVEQMSEKLRQQEAENAKLKKLLEEHLLQTDNEI